TMAHPKRPCNRFVIFSPSQIETCHPSAGIFTRPEFAVNDKPATCCLNIGHAILINGRQAGGSG
ncbi:MAG TPA: hypothetical protein VGJ09_11640, partial [Bryobacteraceae bacterium]